LILGLGGYTEQQIHQAAQKLNRVLATLATG
jgi:GntR family transcriptional regulator/MocR family aminotransferase